MKKIRNLTLRFPIVFCIAFVVLAYGIMKFFSYVNGLMPEAPLYDLLDEVISMAWPVLLAIILGYGFVGRKEGFGRTFKAGWGYFALYAFSLLVTVMKALVMPGIQWQSIEYILIGVVAIIGIGVREEFIFRGVITNALALKYAKNIKGLWITAIVSALLFGFVHMTNMFYGVTFVAALVQCLGVAGSGLIDAAIYLRGGNIWFLVLVHAITDASSLFITYFTVSETTSTDVVNNLNVFGPIVMIASGILVTFFLFRKSKRQEIFDRMDALRAELDC